MSQTVIYHFNNSPKHQTKLQTKFKDAYTYYIMA
jgi:hypothetical protein